MEVLKKALKYWLRVPDLAKVGIFAGLWTLAFGIYFFSFYYPRTVAVTDKNTEISRLNEAIQKSQSSANTLSDTTDELNLMKQKYDKVLELLPSEADNAELLREIYDVAQKSEVEISGFESKEPVVVGFYSQIPISLSLQGGFMAVANFFYRLGKLSRIMRVNDFSLSDPKEVAVGMALSSKAELITYRFSKPTDTEKVEKEGEPTEKRRRRK
jgi:type IV pilus assembly protein PilO